MIPVETTAPSYGMRGWGERIGWAGCLAHVLRVYVHRGMICPMDNELRNQIADAIRRADNNISYANPYTYFQQLADAVMPFVESGAVAAERV